MMPPSSVDGHPGVYSYCRQTCCRFPKGFRQGFLKEFPGALGLGRDVGVPASSPRASPAEDVPVDAIGQPGSKRIVRGVLGGVSADDQICGGDFEATVARKTQRGYGGCSNPLSSLVAGGRFAFTATGHLDLCFTVVV
jgi:hypothetical protein